MNADRTADRLSARAILAGYEAPEAAGAVRAFPSPLHDARVVRDAAWMLDQSDPDLREAGLYVTTLGSPCAQADVYARMRANDEARADLARFVEAELVILDQDPPRPRYERQGEEVRRLWAEAIEARRRWAGELFDALDPDDRDDLKRRVDALRRLRLVDAGLRPA